MAAETQGVLADVVAIGGSAMSAGAALLVAWRGKRFSLEPSLEDVPGAGDKVAALLASVGILLMYATLNEDRHASTLALISVVCAAVAFAALLAYLFLIGSRGFDRYQGLPEQERIIGGFRLTRTARAAKVKHEVDSEQTLFEGLAYDPDSTWTKSSRALARTVCVATFILLLVSGTIALGAAAMRLGLAIAS